MHKSCAIIIIQCKIFHIENYLDFIFYESHMCLITEYYFIKFTVALSERNLMFSFQPYLQESFFSTAHQLFQDIECLRKRCSVNKVGFVLLSWSDDFIETWASKIVFLLECYHISHIY